MVCDWLIRGSHDFFGEISGDFHDIFTTSKVFSRHLFTTFSLHFTTFSRQIFTTNKFSRHPFTTFLLQIFTMKGQTDRDEQTPWGHTDRFHYIFTTFSRQSYHGLLICMFSLHFHDIFMTIVSQAANLHVFTTFSRQIDRFGGLIKRNICYLHPYILILH